MGKNRPKLRIVCAKKYAGLKKVITTIINLVDPGPDREVLREGDCNGRPCCSWLHWIQPCCGKSRNLSLASFHRAAIFKLTILKVTFLWKMGAKRQISLVQLSNRQISKVHEKIRRCAPQAPQTPAFPSRLKWDRQTSTEFSFLPPSSAWGWCMDIGYTWSNTIYIINRYYQALRYWPQGSLLLKKFTELIKSSGWSFQNYSVLLHKLVPTLYSGLTNKTRKQLYVFLTMQYAVIPYS